MNDAHPSPIPAPDRALKALWDKIPSYLKLTFLSAVVLGLGTHLYMFANKIPNHDDILHLVAHGYYATASGRWLLPLVMDLDGTFSMPWLIGVCGVLCLALAACFVVSLLRVRSAPGCIVTAALLVSFPTVTATFTYMFTADAYFLAVAMAAFSAWAAVRLEGWKGFALGAVVLALSMGIYQSYFTVAAALMVGALLFEVLDGAQSFKDLLLRGVRLVAVLAVGLILYFIMVKITTRNIDLVDYMGLSTMGHISLSELPSLLFQSYARYGTYFLKNTFGLHLEFMDHVFLLAAAGSVALFALLLWRRRLGGLRTALAVVLVVLFPLAANIIYLMVPNGGVHMLMIYGMCLITVAPVALADYACADRAELGAGEGTARALLSWILLGSMALAAWSNMVVDNDAYLKMDMGYEQCYAYSARLLSAIEGCEGYERGTPAALVGSSVHEAALDPTPQLDTVNMTGLLDFGDYRTLYTYGHFLQYYLGFSGDVYLDGSEQVTALSALPQVQAMPLYPAAGSVALIDGTVVVKLN